MKPGIYLDRSSGAVYMTERVGQGLVFNASTKEGEEFIDLKYLPKNLERFPKPLETNLKNLVRAIEE